METQSKTVPISVYAEMTPNPATMKFVVNKTLLENGKILEYKDPSETNNSELANKIFNFPFVTGVFINGNYIAVTKNDIIEWEDVTLDLREYITDYLKSGKKVTKNPSQTAQNITSDNEIIKEIEIVPSSEIEEQIFKILEDFVRPAVEQDGGAIDFKSFNKGVLTVTLRGACSGCPSSSVTLKSGILQLFQNMLPAVKDVVAEEM